jgi:enoyl-CoA hydratase/carnithine racemase
MGGVDEMPSDCLPAVVDHVVTLEVPSTLGRKGVAHLRGTVLAALADESVRIVVLRGTAEVFCRGLDLSEICDGSVEETPPIWERATDDFTEILAGLQQARPMTIAVVEGPALGGGVGLAAVCDFVVATEVATFALPELLLGLVPATILPVLGERLGLHQAKRWAMTQATWKASEANTAGLVDRLVSVERLEVEVQRLLRALLRSHPRGVAALKRLTREISNLDVGHATRLGQATLNALLGQIEVRNDLVAFRDFSLLPGEAEV